MDCFINEFISSWWKQLNIYNDTQFEKITKEKLNIVCVQVEKILMNQDKNDIVMSTLYGLANTLIIHMVRHETRNFKNFEKLTIKRLYRENAENLKSQRYLLKIMEEEIPSHLLRSY